MPHTNISAGGKRKEKLNKIHACLQSSFMFIKQATPPKLLFRENMKTRGRGEEATIKKFFQNIFQNKRQMRK